MKIKNYKVRLFVALFLFAAVIISCGKLKEITKNIDSDKKTDKSENVNSNITGKLYFCEDYIQDEEVNVSEKFTTGRITVMVKTDQTISDKDVKLKIEKIKSDGSKEYVKSIPFTIPVAKYFFFKHADLSFSESGKYKVTLLGKDDSPLISGQVQIVD